ncbi:MAG: leucine-rich repeat protein, partial [Oscillospiraceae bacterium]|nr:leucine-rich repeat protein [Oscillospiraceae bacterium]
MKTMKKTLAWLLALLMCLSLLPVSAFAEGPEGAGLPEAEIPGEAEALPAEDAALPADNDAPAEEVEEEELLVISGEELEEESAVEAPEEPAPAEDDPIEEVPVEEAPVMEEAPAEESPEEDADAAPVEETAVEAKETEELSEPEEAALASYTDSEIDQIGNALSRAVKNSHGDVMSSYSQVSFWETLTFDVDTFLNDSQLSASLRSRLNTSYNNGDLFFLWVHSVNGGVESREEISVLEIPIEHYDAGKKSCYYITAFDHSVTEQNKGIGQGTTYVVSLRPGERAWDDGRWYIDEDQCLHITGSGAMPSYSTPPWAKWMGWIYSLEVESGVTTVSSRAFQKLTRLNEASLADSVTFIGQSAFHGCFGLGDIQFPANLELIGVDAFNGCARLSKIALPGRLEILQTRAFNGCTGLKEVRFPKSVTSIGSYAFKDCTGLKKVVIHPDTEVASNAFYDVPKSMTVWCKAGSPADTFAREQGFQVFNGGWRSDSKGWWYSDYEGNYLKNQWQKLAGKWYYFGSDGYAAAGWQKIGGKWYYFNSSCAMQTGWVKVSGKWYYLDSSGVMQTGWQKISGKWYYFNGSGMMQTGWVKVSGKWYFMNASGAMQTGWQKIGAKWYYFGGNGVMRTGWQKISGKWYYFGGNGVMGT